MGFLKPEVGKARKPKFDLHLKIYDLNNVPLVSGQSFVKWHLSHSMTAEHRGRTQKCPIANHRVDYGFVTTVPGIRISIDRNNHLTECPMEFEVIQEFGMTDKVTLGVVRLNLSEYVEESEAFVKDVGSPGRIRSNSVGVGPSGGGMSRPRRDSDVVEDGIVRRYLMQESKVNSTLKISILMIQVDGERSYVAPALKTAPVFGGIGGIMSEAIEDEVGPIAAAVPNLSKPRDAAELQDLYRSVLAASWCRQPNEHSAEEVIEDIFNGGNGWKTKPHNASPVSEAEDDDDDLNPRETIRARDVRRITHNLLHPHHHHGRRSRTASPSRTQQNNGTNGSSHRRTPSNSSDKSFSTVTVTPSNRRKGVRIHEHHLDHARSMASMTSTMTLDSDPMREFLLSSPKLKDTLDASSDTTLAANLPGCDGNAKISQNVNCDLDLTTSLDSLDGSLGEGAADLPDLLTSLLLVLRILVLRVRVILGVLLSLGLRLRLGHLDVSVTLDNLDENVATLLRSRDVDGASGRGSSLGSDNGGEDILAVSADGDNTDSVGDVLDSSHSGDNLVNIENVQASLLDSTLDESVEALKDLASNHLVSYPVDSDREVETIGQTLNTELGVAAQAEGTLGSLRLKTELSKTARVVSGVDAVLLLELLSEVLHKSLVQVNTSKLVVVSGGEDGVEATSRGDNGNIRASATKVGDNNNLILNRGLRTGIVSQNSGNRVGDELEDLKAGIVG
ncbi:hypothetical protein HG530_002235 [Fusarium avenaceum]|nr:hypothetical protein HG530_002235 [Fusarium avenaceum]